MSQRVTWRTLSQAEINIMQGLYLKMVLVRIIWRKMEARGKKFRYLNNHT